MWGFPDCSVGKESTCNAGDPGSILGSERSAREGIGHPFQYTWASLVAQLVKNLPAMRETWIQSLGQKDPLEKGKATHSSILAWRIPWTLWSMGSQMVGHNWATFTFTSNNSKKWLHWYPFQPPRRTWKDMQVGAETRLTLNHMTKKIHIVLGIIYDNKYWRNVPV